MYNVDVDELGRFTRDAPNFPDGHLISPFRARRWNVVSEEELSKLPAPTAEEIARWGELRAQDEQRRVDYMKESAQWFESLGRFVAAFEGMCFALARLAKLVIKKAGVKSEEVRNVLIADYTAKDIANLAQTLLSTTSSVVDGDKDLIKNIFERVKTCIEIRNDVVHSSWLPGGINPQRAGTFLVATGTKYIRKTTQGTAYRRFDYDKAAVDRFRKDFENTALLIVDVAQAAAGGKSLAKTMELDKKEGVVVRLLRFVHTRGGWVAESFPRVVREAPATPSHGGLSEPGVKGDSVACRGIDEDEIVDIIIRDADSIKEPPPGWSPPNAIEGQQRPSSGFSRDGVTWRVGSAMRTGGTPAELFFRPCGAAEQTTWRATPLLEERDETFLSFRRTPESSLCQQPTKNWQRRARGAHDAARLSGPLERAEERSRQTGKAKLFEAMDGRVVWRPSGGEHRKEVFGHGCPKPRSRGVLEGCKGGVDKHTSLARRPAGRRNAL